MLLSALGSIETQMRCFACFTPNWDHEDEKMETSGVDKLRATTKSDLTSTGGLSWRNEFRFSFKDLESVTNNFSPKGFLGEGGFGKVYKGRLQSTGQIVAVKQLNRDGLQGNREFDAEVRVLSLLDHPNLVNLIGYCEDGDQRLLVYEFMPLGSLEDHLHELTPDKESLDWTTRMKIAAGVAEGLEYLHNRAHPHVIYRDLKPSNILLDEGFHPKLSDFGLAKFGPTGDKTHVSTRVMGTYGYCAPEYALTGQLKAESDVYSFGVVLLELITGRRAIENIGGRCEQRLVPWAIDMLTDEKNFHKLVDPKLQGRYPKNGLQRALYIATRCIEPEAAKRPPIAELVFALSYLASKPSDINDKNRSYGARRDEIGQGSSVKPVLDQDRNRAVAEAKIWVDSSARKERVHRF